MSATWHPNTPAAPFRTPYPSVLSPDGRTAVTLPAFWRGVPMHRLRIETIRANLFRGRGG